MGIGNSASSNSLLSRGSSPVVRRSPRRIAVAILGRTASWWGWGDADGKLRGRRVGFYISNAQIGSVIRLDSLSLSNSLELNTREQILRNPSSEVGEASLSVGTGEIIDPPFWLI